MEDYEFKTYVMKCYQGQGIYYKMVELADPKSLSKEVKLLPEYKGSIADKINKNEDIKASLSSLFVRAKGKHVVIPKKSIFQKFLGLFK